MRRNEVMMAEKASEVNEVRNRADANDDLSEVPVRFFVERCSTEQRNENVSIGRGSNPQLRRIASRLSCDAHAKDAHRFHRYAQVDEDGNAWHDARRQKENVNQGELEHAERIC